MDLSPSIGDPLSHVPEYLRRTQQRPASKQQTWVTPCGATDPELLRECIAATYGMIEFIDDASRKAQANERCSMRS